LTTLLVAAAMAVSIAAVISLLMYLPVLAIAETVSPHQPATRAWIWFMALVIPPLVGIGGAGVGIARSQLHPLLSPHASTVRNHLCLRPLFEGPDGQWRAEGLAVLAAALIAASVVRFVLGAINSGRLARLVKEVGRIVTEDLGQNGVDLYLVPGSRAGIVCAGLWRPVIAMGDQTKDNLSTEQLQAAVAHEVAHIRRRDNVAELVGACCVLFAALAPTAYLYRRYRRREAEAACDRMAAQAVGTTEVLLALAAPGGLQAAPAPISWRLAALSDLVATDQDEATSPDNGRDEISVLALVFAIIAVATFGLAVVATLPQVIDSLHCAAETLTEVLR